MQTLQVLVEGQMFIIITVSGKATTFKGSHGELGGADVVQKETIGASNAMKFARTWVRDNVFGVFQH